MIGGFDEQESRLGELSSSSILDFNPLFTLQCLKFRDTGLEKSVTNAVKRVAKLYRQSQRSAVCASPLGEFIAYGSGLIFLQMAKEHFYTGDLKSNGSKNANSAIAGNKWTSVYTRAREFGYAIYGVVAASESGF
ncbi:hypothetical protein TSAR_005465 [Trichomalopsis sarcophagae]|uniref:Uncharacterized protein n=1 Tax=Trichomalopsis sarcophagae TaxID=543379 RepID=A0A232EYD6_9HYME|nr:hypothetical protein TSAR_005465 [Trichomalopsis sarcophagae]